ncbi:hypothetical protein PGH12_01475 [Chryseobacterium wangxinyae]|uniref:hypothetical protein n=1 Tax=Chryseobacterium sp. CY350 TaxID=2997336 RepID=UPI00227001B7|nr:hypothetical protein [Chryseobacterium sp. CY350]MCY0977148.1 hypothetical protein [Chryseobacterium sp. CY350]WBZ95831.1 hypothetical protein PGH12_01475 [Chryseobacterium sp. CY350]
MKQKTTWVTNPTKKQLIAVLAWYTTSFVLIVAVMTELFEKAPAFRENYMLLVVLIFATIAVAKILTNYFKKLNN